MVNDFIALIRYVNKLGPYVQSRIIMVASIGICCHQSQIFAVAIILLIVTISPRCQVELYGPVLCVNTSYSSRHVQRCLSRDADLVLLQ